MKSAASRMTTATLVLGLLLSAVLLLSGCIQSVNLPSGVEAGPNYTMTIQIACPNLTDTRGTLAIRIPTGWTVKSATYTGAVSGTIHKSNNIISYFSTTWEALPPDSSHNGHKPGYSWWAGYTNPETPGGGATATVTIVVDTHDVSGSFFLLDFITGITDKTAPEDPAQNAGGANWQSGTGAGLDPPGFRLDQPVTLLPASIPSVISSDPAEGASGVPVSKAATVTFSEAMDQANITTANLQIFSSGSSTPLPATVSYNAASHVATIDPTNPLAYSAQYMVRVDSGVTDLVGHTMAGTYLAHFTTVAPTAVSLTARTPGPGAVDQLVGTNVTATFDQDMDAATITGSSFSLKKVGSATVVPASVSYSSASKTATLDPTADLEAGSQYEATITTDVKSAEGASVTGAPISWTFTTKSAAPSFTDVSPGDPYYEAIQGMAAASIIQGYAQPGGTYKFLPLNPVYRWQFAKMVVGAFALPIDESMTSPFLDLDPDTPAIDMTEYVAVAYAQGITTGISATEFGPYQNISRAQVVTMVVRALQSLHPGILQTPPAAYANTWGTSFNSIHGPLARIAEYNGLLEGLPLSGAANDPWGKMPRGEVAQVLWNAIGLMH